MAWDFSIDVSKPRKVPRLLTVGALIVRIGFRGFLYFANALHMHS